MTITLHFPPDIEAGLVAQAKAQGLPIDRFLESLIERSVKQPVAWSGQASTKTVVDGIPVFAAGRPMPVEMIQDTIDAIREERMSEPSRLA